MTDLLGVFIGCLITLYLLTEWRRHKLWTRLETTIKKFDDLHEELHKKLHEDVPHEDRSKLMKAVEQGDADLAPSRTFIVDKGEPTYKCVKCQKKARVNPYKVCPNCGECDWESCSQGW